MVVKILPQQRHLDRIFSAFFINSTETIIVDYCHFVKVFSDPAKSLIYKGLMS